jgi:hypothetical protein
MHLNTKTELPYRSPTTELLNLMTAWKSRILHTYHGFKLRHNLGNFDTDVTTGETQRKLLTAKVFVYM